jgi:probable F420-dependent oxidoreductase
MSTTELRPFRFAAVLYHTGGGADWTDKVREAEAMGYDAISQPHLAGVQAPLAAFAAAASVTERVRLSPVVLNPAAWQPETLAHELATLDRLSDGRLEIGLGLGVWKPSDFDRRYPEGRLTHLIDTLAELQRSSAADDPSRLFAQQPLAPLQIAGAGPRVVELAARHADIFNFYTVDRPLPGAAGIALIDVDVAAAGLQRFRELAGARAASVEQCTGLHVIVTDHSRRAAEEIQPLQAPHLSVEQVLASPKTAIGTVEQIVEKLRSCREQLGYTYFLVAESMIRDFQPVLERLAGA